MVPRLTEVFGIREAPSARPDDRHLQDPVAQELSRLFGQIERSMNEVKRAVQSLPVDREHVYSQLDCLQDHTTEIFRNIVDGDPMTRWIRRSASVKDEATMDGPLDHVMAV